MKICICQECRYIFLVPLSPLIIISTAEEKMSGKQTVMILNNTGYIRKSYRKRSVQNRSLNNNENRK